jgi:hypothetical protein
MKVFAPEKDLGDLFQQIMGRPATRKRKKAFKTYVRETFVKAGLERKIVPNVKVRVPVLEKEVEMPFGFRNGRFHLINPVRFGAVDPDQSINTACKYAVEGRLLYEHPSPDLGQMQLVVVGQFRGTDKESPEIVRKLFEESHVKLFSAHELPKLIHEITTTAKDLDGLSSL